MRRFLAASLLLLYLLCSPLHASSVVVITQADSPADTLTAYQLVSIFSLHQQRWSDGTPIRLFILPDRHPTHFEFLNSQLNLFSYQLQQRWDRAVFAGMASMPVTVRDEGQMLERVRQVEGAVGYIDRSSLPAPGVKILEVIREP